jgi:type IV fimbrial biogenesis protein FimT
MSTRLGRTRTAPGQSGGFSLPELLIVLVIAGIVLALGAPSFGDFFRNNRLAEASNGLISASQLARTEAIKRQQNVAVCASANPEAGDAATCSGGPFTGWLVFEDGNGDCARSAGETRIAAEASLHPSVRARSSGTCAAFAANGFAVDLPSGVAATQVLFCDERGSGLQPGTDQSLARGVVLGRTGRTFLTRDPAIIDTWGFTCP